MNHNQTAILPGLSPMTVALLALFGGIACLSIGNVITRFADVGPTASAFYRLFLAMPMGWLWGLMYMQSGGRPAQVQTVRVGWRKLAPYGLACGFFVGAEIALLHHAFAAGQVGVTVFLNNFAPLFVILGSWLLFGERPGRFALICLALAVPGAFLLSGLNPTTGAFVLDDGVVAALLSAVCFAGFVLAGTRMRQHCDAKTVLSWTNMSACLMLAPVAIFNQEVLIAQSWQGWGVLLAMALVSQVLGMRLYTMAMGCLSSVFVSFSSLSQPIMTMLLAWWVLGEMLTSLQLIGAAIVLVALGVNNLAPKKTI